MTRYGVVYRICGIIAVFLAGCGKSEAPSRPATPEAAVKTETVALAKVPQIYDAVGTVRSKTSTVVSSKILGQVTAVNVREGDRVNAGDVLAQIDTRGADASLDKARAGLTEAQQAVQEAEDAIKAAEAAKAVADANLELAKATRERFQRLIAQEAVSRQAYDEAEAKYRGAAAEVTRAAETLNSLKARRAQASAKIRQAGADVTNAQVGQSDAKILAPMAGLITMKKVEVGDMASPGAPLFELEDRSSYRLEAKVDENRVGRIKAGQPVQVTIDALDDLAVPATVAEIVPMADPGSRSFVVKLDLPSQDAMRSGMFGKAHFPVGEKQVLSVPRAALVERGQLTGVYVVDGESVARLRLVTVGKDFGERIEVLSGLNAGEAVVVEGAGKVADGMKVRRG